jgi:ABC-type xylose transport system permease subunit
MRKVFIMIVAMGWVFVFLATRSEAVSLGKMQRVRGSVRSAQIVSCDVKKCDSLSAIISDLTFEAIKFGDFKGFLLSFRGIPENFGPRLGSECVLLL